MAGVRKRRVDKSANARRRGAIFFSRFLVRARINQGSFVGKSTKGRGIAPAVAPGGADPPPGGAAAASERSDGAASMPHDPSISLTGMLNTAGAESDLAPWSPGSGALVASIRARMALQAWA